MIAVPMQGKGRKTLVMQNALLRWDIAKGKFPTNPLFATNKDEH